MDAVYADMMTAIRLVLVCIGDHGFAGCICQMALTLQPSWRKYSTNKEVRCENGDPFGQILGQVEKVAIEMVEPPVNNLIGGINSIASGIDGIMNGIEDVINAVPGVNIDIPGVGRLPQLCIRTAANAERPGVAHCGDGLTPEEAAAVTQCEDDSRGKEYMCFYERVLEICGSGTMLSDWRALFAAGYESIEELEQEFVEAFADSYNTLDPILVALLEAVEVSASGEFGPDLELRKDLCSTNAFASAMTLDMIITSCFFSMAEGACHGPWLLFMHLCTDLCVCVRRDVSFGRHRAGQRL